VTTKAHRSDSNRHECLEANYALSGLYAEDVADNIERFAGNYEKGLEETATTVEERSDKGRAASI